MVRLEASPVHVRRRLTALGVLVAIAVVLTVVLTGGGHPASRFAPAAGPSPTTRDPIAYDAARRGAFERAAAGGVAHVLYAKSVGGVVATARRVAAFRPLVDRAGWDPDTLEALIFLESGGRPDAQAGSDPSAAAGLTQIVAETGRDLLHMRIDLARTRTLERAIAGGRRVAARQRELRRVDERFDPAKAIAATVRYLRFARAKLGRDDLAVASYHMGVGNLQSVMRAYGAQGAGGTVSYAQLYFDSSPLHHAAAWNLLASFGDDSSTYLWRIEAAKEIMRLYRTRPAELRRLAALQMRSGSSERVMHPAASAATAGQLARLPVARLRRDGIAVGGRIAAGGLRPRALAALEVLGAGTQAIARTSPLLVTGLDATGWSFDVSRVYRSGAQALAFQFMLDRLTALGWIAWERDPTVIHVTAAAKPPV
ncbi:MAG TPA: transglycosylase SLT domain-containing protein [Solirubrobacteraceae bacterium]|nr:transglycosylase SLT domain-containing protein [Solirubrobacteraceae bacterium]